MKWTVDHSRTPLYIRVKVEGTPTVEDTLELWEQLLSCKNWRPGTGLLIDNSEIGPGSAGSQILDALAKYLVIKQKAIGDSRIAVLGSKTDINRYSRQLEYGLKLRGVSLLVRNFGDEPAAVEWLTIQAASN